MFSCYGWCKVLSSREPYIGTNASDSDAIDKEIDKADKKLWDSLRLQLADIEDVCFKWQFSESLNFDCGILNLCISRNHRGSGYVVLKLFEWIAVNGPGSHGLLYVFDDEDSFDSDDHPRYSRFTPPKEYDYTNVYRVFVMSNGQVIEKDDPFFGNIVPDVIPGHPMDDWK